MIPEITTVTATASGSPIDRLFIIVEVTPSSKDATSIRAELAEQVSYNIL